jgi:hypothetical protein
MTYSAAPNGPTNKFSALLSSILSTLHLLEMPLHLGNISHKIIKILLRILNVPALINLSQKTHRQPPGNRYLLASGSLLPQYMAGLISLFGNAYRADTLLLNRTR